jgi:predicted TIM-barrel fold metal-dependent hydrolase
MRIIDTHIHFSNMASFKEWAVHTSHVNFSEDGYLNEAKENNIVHSICMGIIEDSAGSFPDTITQTPMLAGLTDKLPSSISLCIGINPHTLNDQSIARMVETIKNDTSIAGIKIYAGYYHFDVCDNVYSPVYRLAEKYELAVAIHSGDLFSDRGLLEYAHPLKIDRLAVEHPEIRIVICHMGSPWVFDACEVALKNKNVYLDLSGLLTGNREYINRMASKQLILDRYRSALVYLDNYDKVLFGTDWPLTPMDAYIEFCKELVPADTYNRVFYQNAVNVFKLKF